ncbi:uncharacterized protein [Asterias amurensis]|uniref:uncharacterized protein n=1 Tax=Asterias amurensis TaxID=7602 RepID=UPI003AB7D7A8
MFKNFFNCCVLLRCFPATRDAQMWLNYTKMHDLTAFCLMGNQALSMFVSRSNPHSSLQEEEWNQESLRTTMRFVESAMAAEEETQAHKVPFHAKLYCSEILNCHHPALQETQGLQKTEQASTKENEMMENRY